MKACPICQRQYQAGETFCPTDGARLVTPSLLPAALENPGDPLIGATLDGRYRILRRIGEGGMGIVYEAEHVIIEKRVALKVLRADFSSRPDLVERFRQEAKSASRIGHSHIVSISDFGETPAGDSYFVMEMLDGEDLANVLEREGLLAPARTVNVVLQCARALGAAHAKGIVHRDMKPENVFLCEQDGLRDFVKIVDFGIAKMNDLESTGQPGRRLTKTGMIFGTPEYMAPEQASGQSLDHRVDIYAVGIILYELITGRVPFRGDNFLKVLSAHTGEPPAPLGSANPNVQVSEALERVVFRALAKHPNARFQSMDEMAQALLETPEAGEAFPLDSMSALITLPTEEKAPAQRRQTPTMESFPGVEQRAQPRRGQRGWAVAAAALLMVGAGVAVWISAGAYGLVRTDLGLIEGPPPLDPKLLSAAVEPASGAPAAEPPSDRGSEDLPDMVFGSEEPEAEAQDAGVTEGAAGDAAEAAAQPKEAQGPKAAPPPERRQPRRVAVEVRTRPAGAVVSVVGSEIVCKPSPCKLEVPHGAKATVLARRGRLRASANIIARESKTLLLRLRRPRRR